MYNEMLKGIFKKTISVLSIILLLYSTSLSVFADVKKVNANQTYEFDKPYEIGKDETYAQYIIRIKDHEKALYNINIPIDQFTKSDNVEVKSKYENSQGNVLFTYDNSFVEWTFEVKSDAVYNMKINYIPLKGKYADIKRELYIDGKVPFYEALDLTFQRKWKDAEVIKSDKRGNDITPRQVEAPQWTEDVFRNLDGAYDGPYDFYFTKGIHKIRLVSVSEPMAISSLALTNEPKLKTYKETIAINQKNGYREVQVKPIIHEAEKSYMKSSPTLCPIYDKSSPKTSPSSYSKLRLNTIGGDRWKFSGDWISWKMSVPETGLYKIALKERQNLSSGTFSSRKLYIDGQIPFVEVQNIQFTYDDVWKMKTLGNKENKEFLFYLEKGEHEIKLETVLGDVQNIISEMNTALYDNNTIYRQIIMITGTSPDEYRDYEIQKQLPKLIEQLKKQQNIMETALKEIISFTGKRGSSVVSIEKMLFRLNKMIKNPDKIPSGVQDYKECITSLGTWLLSAKEQPLELDYLVIYSSSQQLPNPKGSFLDNIIYGMMSFLSSYFEDYNAIGNSYSKDKAITVWIGSGRDQAQVIKRLIDERFTTNQNIDVNLSLVNMATSLLPATLAKKGPDIALYISQTDAINYSMRHASVDLTGFKDYGSVKSRFYESAVIPFTYDGGVYALPETQSFPLLFYRKDILAELGIKSINTWDDVYNALPILQKKYLNFGLPVSSLTSYGMLLYQKDGMFYTKNNVYSGIDSETGVAAFKMLTDFYTSYVIPQEYDFATRFRIGEIPIAVADYTMYNLLSVFAPEIDGMWGFLPVPGTVTTDGTINRSVPGTCSGCMMLSESKNKDYSWKFMKWWTNADIQTEYGRELENVMGVGARFPTANIDAMNQIPWSSKELDIINEQWKYVKAIPEVPGGYYTARQLDYALKSVVISGNSPRDSILDYTKSINQELKEKRKEFGLATIIDDDVNSNTNK